MTTIDISNQHTRKNKAEETVSIELLLTSYSATQKIYFICIQLKVFMLCKFMLCYGERKERKKREQREV